MFFILRFLRSNILECSFSNFTISCSDDFNIEIKRCAFQKINFDPINVYAGSVAGDDPDSVCRSNVTNDTVFFNFPFTSCTTVVDSNDTHLMYSNKLHGLATSTGNYVINRDQSFIMPYLFT